MNPRYRQPERTEVFPSKMCAEVGTPLLEHDVRRKKIWRHSIPLTKSVRIVALHDVREERRETIVVGTQHRHPIEGNFIDKFEKTFVDSLHRPIMIQVLTIQIRHRNNGGRKTQKRSVAFICLGHQEVASTKPCMASQCVHLATDHHRWIQVALRKHGGHHRRRSCFTVSSGNGNAEF